MPLNADKPQMWKADTRCSVDQLNQWLIKFAPKAYRSTRKRSSRKCLTLISFPGWWRNAARQRKNATARPNDRKRIRSRLDLKAE